MVDSTDLTAYATIILAIATFLLAYYTYKSVKTSENLAKNTQTQTDIILSQQKPQLTSEITYSTNDLINIDVTNHGPGTAYDIAP
jgi:archaellum component FlaF (FlaF/FlaG flagellin family)